MVCGHCMDMNVLVHVHVSLNMVQMHMQCQKAPVRTHVLCHHTCLLVVEAAGDPSGSSDYQHQDDQQFDALMQRLPSPQSKLEKHAREFFLHQNRSIAKGGQGRDQRFIHKGKLGPEKQDDDDVYISDDDCIAVLYDMTEGGPFKKERKFEVFFGNVAKLTYEKGGKLVPGPRASFFQHR